MTLPEAKETLETMCLEDQVTSVLLQASTVILERLEAVDKPAQPPVIPPLVPLPAATVLPESLLDYDEWPEYGGCGCRQYRTERGEV